MKCKKCGNEVDIGEVYCQKCGTAIQIVPEYNPLEDEINAVLEQKPVFEGNTTLLPPKEEYQEQENLQKLKQYTRKRKQIIGISVVATVFIIAGISVMVYLRYQKIHSFDYQYEMGLQYVEEEKYSSALPCFEKALEYQQDSIEARLAASDIYFMLGDYSRTVELLLEVVNLNPSAEYYKKLMKACEAAGNTELMNKILRENQGNSIGEALSQYRVEKINVNLPGGNYEDYLKLTLSSDQKDVKIYYTLDGTEPTESSILYTKPIEFNETGTFILRAVAYNASHIAGEERKETYTIEFVAPDAPDVSPASGSYQYGEKIAIEVPEGATGYFTIDGTTPDREHSYVYTDPISMPVGNTVFAAIVVDKHDISSPVTKKNYSCSINRPFGYDAAVIKLKNYLVEIGMIADLSGNRGNGEKISVEFKALSLIENIECYVFTLRRTVDYKTTTLDDKIYAVTTQTGEVYSLSGSDGRYAFIKPAISEQKESETQTEIQSQVEKSSESDAETTALGEE